ncbi:hypothetical protein Q3G72_006392 [Acer saccharum]|nr:hypothetical protein Q3G72_006392 [Acer saccharum]
MYGPWLLVSYGRKGKRNYKGRNGRNEGGKFDAADNSKFARKIYGNGNSIATKPKGEQSEANLIKASGSRFDILREEIEELMVEGEGHVTNKNNEGIKHKGKSSRKIIKSGDKRGKNIGRVVEVRVGVFKVKGSSSNMSMDIAPPLITQGIVSSDLDSISVLGQLHANVANFDEQNKEHNKVSICLNQNSSDNIVPPLVNNFDVVAAELKKAMTVIFD